MGQIPVTIEGSAGDDELVNEKKGARPRMSQSRNGGSQMLRERSRRAEGRGLSDAGSKERFCNHSR